MATATLAAGSALALYLYSRRSTCSPDLEHGPLFETHTNAHRAPETFGENLFFFAEGLRYTFGETFARWRTADLLIGLAYLCRRENEEHPCTDIAVQGRVYAETISNDEHRQAVNVELKEIERFFRYCSGLRERRPAHQRQYITTVLEIPEENLLIQELNAGVLKPSYILTRDQKLQSIVLAIRGTHSFKDAFTSLTGASKPHHVFDSNGVVLGYSHFGMLAAARWLKGQLKEKLDQALADNPGYRLQIIGHSLGAGTAAMLTMMLREEGGRFSEATCVAIACPCCMTLELAKSCSGYVTTVINGADVIPTVSPGSADKLRQDVTRSSWFQAFQQDVRSNSVVKAVESGIKGVGSVTMSARNWTTSRLSACYQRRPARPQLKRRNSDNDLLETKNNHIQNTASRNLASNSTTVEQHYAMRAEHEGNATTTTTPRNIRRAATEHLPISRSAPTSTTTKGDALGDTTGSNGWFGSLSPLQGGFLSTFVTSSDRLLTGDDDDGDGDGDDDNGGGRMLGAPREGQASGEWTKKVAGWTQQVTTLTGRSITETSRVAVQAVQSSSMHAVNAVQSTGNLFSKMWTGKSLQHVDGQEETLSQPTVIQQDATRLQQQDINTETIYDARAAKTTVSAAATTFPLSVAPPSELLEMEQDLDMDLEMDMKHEESMEYSYFTSHDRLEERKGFRLDRERGQGSGSGHHNHHHHVRGGSLEAELDFRMQEVAAAVSAAEAEEERTNNGHDAVPSIIPVGTYSSGESCSPKKERKNDDIAWKRNMFPAGRIMHLVPARLVPGIDPEVLVKLQQLSSSTTNNTEARAETRTTSVADIDIAAMEESFGQVEMLEDGDDTHIEGEAKQQKNIKADKDSQQKLRDTNRSTSEIEAEDESPCAPPASASNDASCEEAMILLDAIPQEAYGRIKLSRRVLKDHIIPNYLKSLESALVYIHRDACSGQEQTPDQGKTVAHK